MLVPNKNIQACNEFSAFVDSIGLKMACYHQSEWAVEGKHYCKEVEDFYDDQIAN